MSDKKIAKVKVDPNSCGGCGVCVATAPDAFEFKEGETTSSAKDGAEKASDELLLQVAQSCPLRAISLYDSKGNRIFP